MSTKDSSSGRIPYFDDFVSFYEQSPLTLPATDIFCCGPFNTLKRVAALVNVLSMMKDEKRQFPISRILAVFPASSPQSLESFESNLRSDVRKLMTHLHGTEAATNQARFLKEILRAVSCPNLEVGTAINLIAETEQRSVVIFVDAAKYRTNSLVIERPSDSPTTLILEDLWVHHLQIFARRAVAAAAPRDCYVVLDTGQPSPYKPENAEILRAVAGCGIMGTRIADDPREIVISRLDQWAKRVESGRLGPVFSEIDGLPESLAPEKRLLKIQLLSRAALPVQMLELLKQEVPEITEINPDVLVRFARFAQQAGDPELASRFLVSAIPELTSQEDLGLASSICYEIDDGTLEDSCLRRIETLFPNSHVLHDHRLTSLIDSRKYAEAAAMVSNPIFGFSAEAVSFHKELAIKLEGTSQPDYESALATVRARWPALLDRGRLIGAADARARRLPKEALLILADVPMDRVSHGLAISYLRSIEQAFILRTGDGNTLIHDDVLRRAILALIRYSSRNPDDGVTRGGLITILSPQISGATGLFLLAAVVLELSKRDTVTRGTQHIRDRSSINVRDLPKFLEPVLQWMSEQSPVAVGRCVLPDDFLATPADGLIGPLEMLLQGAATKVASEDDRIAFEKLLFAAILVAKNSSNPDDDLAFLHMGASKLAMGGRVQRARDLVEEALQIAGKNSRRARLAWYGFADVYQRLHNPVEALLGMACTLDCGAERTTEQAWYETYLLIRLLRDLHMTEAAKSLLPLGQSLVQALGPDGEYQHRFVTLELSVRLLDLLGNPAGRGVELQGFVSDVEKLCATVLERDDEIAPAAALLAEGLHLCRLLKIPFSGNTSATLELVLAKAGQTWSAIIRTLTVQKPNAADVINLALRLEPARYPSDTGFDVRYVVIAARRLLDCSEGVSDSRETAMAIELLADHALRRHAGVSETQDALHGLPVSVQEPAEFAEEFSKLGINVILLGLNANGSLVRVTATKGALGAAVCEDCATFSQAKLNEWSKQFPYAYGQVSETDNLFYTSTRGLGLTITESGRTLFVMDAGLAQLSPNLLLVSDEFIGRSTPVAAAPSLAWLRSAHSERHKTGCRRVAWISTAAKQGEDSTLRMLAERLGPTLKSQSIKLDSGPKIPAHLSGSELVIVAAHGGIVPEGRFFQTIANDADLKLTSADLSNALTDVQLVILFVCSGGRFDRHPFANTTVGLARDLLNRGCTTVIASPWPLDTRVPSHWLPQFLALWESGSYAIDANFEANRAVAKAMGDSPARCLAMTVFGDPLLIKEP
jgi:hypothetical protein